MLVVMKRSGAQQRETYRSCRWETTPTVETRRAKWKVRCGPEAVAVEGGRRKAKEANL